MTFLLVALLGAYGVVATREVVRARRVLDAARAVSHFHDNGEMSNLALDRLAVAISRYDGEDEDP